MDNNQMLQYQEWLREERRKVRCAVSEKEVHAAIMKDLNMVREMDAKEYTLYRKWQEVRDNRIAMAKSEMLSREPDEIDHLPNGRPRHTYYVPKEILEDLITYSWASSLIWSKGDIQDIHPEVTLCTGNKLMTRYWNFVRTFTSAMPNNSNPGRMLRFLVADKVTTKAYGVISLASDMRDLRPRDEFIGWSRAMRGGNRMWNHTAAGSSLVPTQPFGWNYLGGKLISLLALSDVVEKAWNERYPNKLVGVTTTSLYGLKSQTQYSQLEPYWNELGESDGTTCYEPTQPTFQLAKEYLRQEFPERYWRWFEAKRDSGLPLTADIKQRSLTWLYQQLGLDESLYRTGHKRGVYFAELFENTREFLRGEITEAELVNRKDIKRDVESLTKYWKEHLAAGRIKHFNKKGKFDFDIRLFYEDLTTLTWEQTKEKYLYGINHVKYVGLEEPVICVKVGRPTPMRKSA